MRSLIFLLLLSFNATAALYDRGNGLIYDDVLDITWLQDANYAQTSGYTAANANGSVNSTDANIQPDGRMGWQAAKTWADTLVYFGYEDWRLPSANLMNDANPCWAYDGSCDEGYNNTTSETAHMFFNNLGGIGRFDVNGIYDSAHGVTNYSFTDGGDGISVSFFNLQNHVYWSREENTLDTYYAWRFGTDDGTQLFNLKKRSLYSWAVHDGDIGNPVPLPAGIYLFLSGLVGLSLMKGRKSNF